MVFRPAHAAEQNAAKPRPTAVNLCIRKAVILDLDGVVADRQPIDEIAWAKLLVEQGRAQAGLNLDFLYAGHPRRAVLKQDLGAVSESDSERLARRKNELYAEAAAQLKPKPRISDVVRRLNKDGTICALATSANSGRTYKTLAKIARRKDSAAIVTREEAGRPKPAPDISLLTAAIIDAETEYCVVVEDPVAGVPAARAAGMKCVGWAAVKRFGELAEAGAHDLISELSTGYFNVLLHASDEATAAGERV